ncbi:MAG: penicillin-binding transpeptidase domain-containing protein [Brevibacterium sp.]
MSKRSRVWLAIVLVLILIIGAGAFAFLRLPMQKSVAAEAAAADLADGSLSSETWHNEDLAQSLFDRVTKSLGTRIALRSVAVDEIREREGNTVAELRWTWANHDDEAWTYTSELPLQKNGLFWWADLTEQAIHPELGKGGRFELRANPGERGKILGADGKTLTEEGEVIGIGVHPARLEPDTLSTLVDALNEGIDSLDLDADALEKKVDAADADQQVPVVTLRKDDYTAVKKQIHDLPGVLFTEATQTLTRSKGFAQATLGSAGPASAEDIENSGGEIISGEVVGRSGLQKTFDEALRGPGSEEVFAAGEAKLSSLHAFEKKDGEDLETTLDVRIQDAADAAAATGKKPTAIVAIRPSDGHILAVANHDPEGSPWDRALTGQYSPGSVFKVASSLALLESGVGVGTKLDCPKTTTVDGKEFKNAEDHVLGEVSFEENFAESCNTAFVNAAEAVSSADVADAAAQLGMTAGTGGGSGSNDGSNGSGQDGATTDLGIGAKMASVPVDDDPVTHAAQMIGQGKVQASPLAVATMTASADMGIAVTPRLVLDDEATADEGDGSGSGADAQPEELADEDAQALATMMREAVRHGTASGVRDVPGAPVHGKTGTAEYGDETPPRTHSWFAGYQEDVAVAVLVEDGGFGAEAAVPVAEEFFQAVN